MSLVFGCAVPSSQPSSSVQEIRREEELLTRLLELQTLQERELSEVKQMTQDHGERYGQLFATLDTLLKNSEEHKKNSREIRNAVTEAHKPNSLATQAGGGRKATPASVTSKKVIGGVALLHLIQPNIVLRARVDTGAETASLDARNIELFERDGEEWVRFSIPDAKDNRMVPTEHKLSRKVKILQATNESSDRRLVVELAVEIAGISQVAEFTLTDREHLSYPALIGRNILKDVMVVDVALPVPKLP